MILAFLSWSFLLLVAQQYAKTMIWTISHYYWQKAVYQNPSVFQLESKFSSTIDLIFCCCVPFSLSHPQASNPLYKHPVSTHYVETDFNMYGKSYNGGVHWSFSTGHGRTGPKKQIPGGRGGSQGEWKTKHTLTPLCGSHQTSCERDCLKGGNLQHFSLKRGDSSMPLGCDVIFFFFVSLSVWFNWWHQSVEEGETARNPCFCLDREKERVAARGEFVCSYAL